ncbi:MAG: hypothetical protein LBD06_00535 [Candidatus Accumulibacter sp.]|nr:hypothetical protein [Accumulibacter sp.]
MTYFSWRKKLAFEHSCCLLKPLSSETVFCPLKPLSSETRAPGFLSSERRDSAASSSVFCLL